MLSHKLLPIHFLLLACWIGLIQCPQLVARDYESIEDLRADRKKLAHQQRRIIANNDGCDCLYFPAAKEASEENFLEARTTMLRGSQVDTISYCTISSGFGQFSHRTEAGTVFTRQGKDYDIQPHSRNITGDLIARGTDPLQAVTGFARGNGIESFWSFRMNDTHDAAHHPDRPYFLYPELKEQHPEWLVGNWKDRTPHGRWSSVNYAVPEVRDLAFTFVEEVCQNYDVDGVEMDFFRHLTYFKSTAFGGKASKEECELMTGLLRRIREMSEQEGMKRGRPVLIAIRVPDDAAYCRDMGLDVDQWMKEGLIDMLITTGYFRLHRWQESVRWAHQHGVSIYPALTDPRVKGETDRLRRSSDDAYRARAARAWAAGADGVYCFNLYDVDRNSPLWGQIGDPKALAFSKKLYFVTDVDGSPNSWLADGVNYRDVPIVTPSAPAKLQQGETFSTVLDSGEDTAAAHAAGYLVDATLHLETPGLKAEQLEVRLNGTLLEPAEISDSNDWSDFGVPGTAILSGENRIEVGVRSTPDTDAATNDEGKWTHIYDGSTLPPALWRRDGSGTREIDRLADDGSLFIADWGETIGSYRLYRHSWGTDPEAVSVLQARAKIGTGLNYLIFTNGVAGERLRLLPDRVMLYHHPKQVWEMDTTDDFHDYRIELHGSDVKVFVDGELRIDAADAMTVSDSYPRNEICFGGANNTEHGTAWWDDVRFRSKRKDFALNDVALSVEYRKK